jgi:hypothetical protein
VMSVAKSRVSLPLRSGEGSNFRGLFDLIFAFGSDGDEDEDGGDWEAVIFVHLPVRCGVELPLKQFPMLFARKREVRNEDFVIREESF